ncbi:MAG: gamma carbonic anhydrase family protein [Deltaproteobacteria bacterium]|nr:gamma carbonic anhydrase family protein [Deltaproteobacteria bacterium]
MIRSFNGKTPQIDPSAFVSEAATVIGNVSIGAEASIWPGAVIRGDFGRITIAAQSCLEDNCVVHGAGDVTIGKGVIVGHGAVVHCLSIGDHVLVGNNATVLDGARIGDGCIIGAGALVAPGTVIPQGSLFTGTPGSVKREVSSSEMDRLENGTAAYVSLAGMYKKEGL